MMDWIVRLKDAVEQARVMEEERHAAVEARNRLDGDVQKLREDQLRRIAQSVTQMESIRKLEAQVADITTKRNELLEQVDELREELSTATANCLTSRDDFRAELKRADQMQAERDRNAADLEECRASIGGRRVSVGILTHEAMDNAAAALCRRMRALQNRLEKACADVAHWRGASESWCYRAGELEKILYANTKASGTVQPVEIAQSDAAERAQRQVEELVRERTKLVAENELLRKQSGEDQQAIEEFRNLARARKPDTQEHGKPVGRLMLGEIGTGVRPGPEVYRCASCGEPTFRTGDCWACLGAKP